MKIEDASRDKTGVFDVAVGYGFKYHNGYYIRCNSVSRYLNASLNDKDQIIGVNLETGEFIQLDQYTEVERLGESISIR